MRTLIFIILVLLLAAGAAVAGTGPQKIQNTIHNFSSTAYYDGLYNAGNEDEICVFCHTPHGGSLDGPLWNRDLTPHTGYTHYSSESLSTVGGLSDDTRTVNSESLLCLSCHDGTISMGDNLLNTSGVIPDNDIGYMVQLGWNNVLGVVVPGPQVGASYDGLQGATTSHTDLSDDHPISFSYSAVQAARPLTLNADVDGKIGGMVLFGVDKNVECATCHDPHVNYDTDVDVAADPLYDPFLAIPNTNSGMCLACHIK